MLGARGTKVVNTNTHTRGLHICGGERIKERNETLAGIGGGAAQDFDLHSP